MAFLESNFRKFLSGGGGGGVWACPPYKIRAFGAYSPLVSKVTLCLMFSFKKTPYRDWMKQKFEHQRIQNGTKLPLRKSLS